MYDARKIQFKGWIVRLMPWRGGAAVVDFWPDPEADASKGDEERRHAALRLKAALEAADQRFEDEKVDAALELTAALEAAELGGADTLFGTEFFRAAPDALNNGSKGGVATLSETEAKVMAAAELEYVLEQVEHESQFGAEMDEARRLRESLEAAEMSVAAAKELRQRCDALEAEQKIVGGSETEGLQQQWHEGCSNKTRLSCACPVVRQRWRPEHEPGVPDGVLVARDGAGKKYHYSQRCPALQWGHCEVSVHVARENDCAECTQCRRQRVADTWHGMSGFPADAWRSDAPVGVDPTEGDVSWVDSTVDMRLVHWMCVARGLDAGGSDQGMLEQLREWQRVRQQRNADADASESEASHKDFGPPPAYNEFDAPSAEQQRRCVMMPVSGHGQGGAQGGDGDSALAMVIQVDGVSAAAGLDTWAETSVIRRSCVKPGWKVRCDKRKAFDGLGSSGVEIGEELEVPIQMRFGGEKIFVVMRVVEDSDMHAPVDVLLGTQFQRKARMNYDVDNMRVELRTMGVVADLESIDVIIERMVFEPLRVLELCAGMSGSYGVLVDLGYKIGVWDAVESDSAVADVAKKAYPQLRHVGRDVVAFRVDGKYYLVLVGPPCQPWSRAAGVSAKGFRDKRAKPFKAMCATIHKCIEKNPGTAFMVETVVVNKRVAADAAEKGRLLGASFQQVTPVDLGWPQSRTRRIAQNVVGDLRQLEKKEPFDPNIYKSNIY